MQQIWDAKRQIADLDGQIRQVDSDIGGIVSDQTRIRQNIKSLNQVSGQQDQVQKYARQLGGQESALACFAGSVERSEETESRAANPG